MEFRLTFGVRGNEYDGDDYSLDPESGLTPETVPSLAEGLTADLLSVGPGSVGKGASGPGIELVLTVAERAMNDGASVAAYGAILWQLVKRVRARQERELAVQDPATIGALALGINERSQEQLRGAHVMPSVCFTGGGPGMGTDIRDVWATPVVLPDEQVLVIFSSPSGMILGETTVRPEWTSG
jgi:hypothetical protein